ncbi:hypothetical protein [Mesorhizobium opportunistum]|uniref:Uncharacterized protein n=1 Tax=Mesorhizobium opportunistum (strain LMG 24607 / HAMBI 3007 / WSM2075) TaxID=536019 RepID=F7YHH6_MESOW|nr:hypothetical protein [Mesorhizobium opportunistum]AEH89276.1 hypothetical protein Mesop_4856 [Mesorhizobium opportunistum WSM2075]
MAESRRLPPVPLYVIYALLVLALTYLAYALYFNFFRDPEVHGDFDISILRDYKAPLIASVGTFLGVISKSIYEYITEKPTDLKKGIISASLIAPIVVMYTYNSIISITDSFVAFLISYQNGFFFRIILASVESKYSKKPQV